LITLSNLVEQRGHFSKTYDLLLEKDPIGQFVVDKEKIMKIISSKKTSRFLMVAILALSILSLIAPSVVNAKAPDKEEFFICPSVSTHNQNGMWVMGAHGAYYVLVPAKGGANENSKVFLTVPISVPDKAQVPAGWALYKDVETYPNFEGMVVLLGEGIDTFLGSPVGWEEEDVAKVMNNGDGTYTVMNMGSMMNPSDKGSIVIDYPIPLAGAAIW
jgi:hypothetical protein